jgi:predicted deacylase
MLVAHHLRQRLAALQAAGPRASAKSCWCPRPTRWACTSGCRHGYQGRFDLASGENFNRHYADLTDAVAGGARPSRPRRAANVACVRAALREAVAALPARPARWTACAACCWALAVDADIVIDLHCDSEACCTCTPPRLLAAAEPLARCLGVQAVLLAESSGGDPFDEACSMSVAGPGKAPRAALPLPQACLAVTVELRGEADVEHALAAADAEGLLHFLALQGLLDVAAAEPPPLRCTATPLAGSVPIVAPHGGVVVFARSRATRCRPGPDCRTHQPAHRRHHAAARPVAGLFFARDNRRFARAGSRLGKVAGTQALRQGSLLSP